MNKTFVMVAGAFCAAIMPVLMTAGPLTVADWINVILIGLGAVQVYISKNLSGEPVWNYTKAIIAGLTTAGTMVMSGVGGLTGSQVAQIVVAAVATIGVYAIPNPDTSPGKHEANATQPAAPAASPPQTQVIDVGKPDLQA